MGSREKLLPYSANTSPIVTVMSPQMSSGTSDEMPDEIPDYLRRTNSSSSIVTLGM